MVTRSDAADRIKNAPRAWAVKDEFGRLRAAYNEEQARADVKNHNYWTPNALWAAVPVALVELKPEEQ